MGKLHHLALFDSVHPHVCGEHNNVLNFGRVNHGSSPRVWGTWVANNAQGMEKRFIPTCVGNMRLKDEPIIWIDGSSPRVWGTSIR